MSEGEVPEILGPSRVALQDAVVGVVQEWFEGWITTDDVEVGQIQYRVVPLELTDKGMRFILEGPIGIPNPEGEYEVVVKVKRR